MGLYVSGDAEGRFREIFDALAVGSDPALFDELHEEPFGTYGHLADRFGVHWFFRGEPGTEDYRPIGPNGADRPTPAKRDDRRISVRIWPR